MDTTSYKTKSATPDTIERSWYIVDAEDKTLGRMSTQIAHVLRGKNKSYYTPHMDCGDYVIVVNAEKVKLTGNKWSQKEYQRYSGYPGGQKTLSAQQVLDRKPEAIVESAVKGMLPKNRLGRAMFRKLFVYAGEEHPHSAQKPEPLNS